MVRKMKDSGVEWIGETPENWNVTKFKYVMKKEKVLCENYTNENILSLTKSGVIVRDVENPTGKMPATFNGYQYVKEGDLLLCLFDIDVTPRCVGIVKDNGITSPAYSRYHLKKGNSLRYYNYLLTYLDDKKILLSFTKSLRNTLTDEYFGVVKTLSPSLVEQQKIADFLDEKTSHLDSVIEKTKQSIEEIKKYKHALVTEAVTKGLNPAVNMKDSGIKWIGEIPEHWEMKKMKKIIKSPLQYGANESGEPFSDSDPRYIRITDITADNQLKNTGRLSLPFSKAQSYLLEDNDILFARSGGTVGKTFLYKSKYGLSAFAGYLIKASIIDKIDPKYVYYYTLSYSYEKWKEQIFIQSTIQNIGADKYANLQISIPPDISEQQQIVDYLDENTTHVDSLIESKVSMISQLVEYKKSMIYEYVTGKKEVE